MAEAYRFNGPVPEAVKQLKQRFSSRLMAADERRSRLAFARKVLNDPSAPKLDQEMARAILAKRTAKEALRLLPVLSGPPAQIC